MNDKNLSNNAIGVMDSGVGGLTVVSELQQLLPNESIIYYGDSANCPYGNRGEDEIVALASGIINFLEANQVKIVVIACNTMSTIVNKLTQKYDIEIVGIVRPAAAFIAKIKPKKIGVVATVFTTSTKEYDNYIHKYLPETTVYSQGSPSLAALIESGEFDYSKIDAEITKEVDSILKHDSEVSDIVLGCTHYPIVLDQFQKLYPQIRFVNPAHEQALYVKDYLTHYDMLNSGSHSEFTIYTSGEPITYKKIVDKLKLQTPTTITQKIVNN
ncbi:glutamate racemase [Enterococcus alishanensis]